MQGFCPHCEEQRELNPIHRIVEYEVRGEHIEIETDALICSICGHVVEQSDASFDPLDLAYREYRRRHNLIQPEQILEFRSSIGLSQKELSQLLGWGGATLSRYENGALQDEAHNNALQLAMAPRGLLELIQTKPDVLPHDKREQLILDLMQQVDQNSIPLRQLYLDRFGQYQPDAFSGFRKLDLEKLFSAIIYFSAQTEVVKTKLNKLLFYVDFKHYKEYMVSITGVRYAHLPYGPVPDNYVSYLAALTDEEKAITIEERVFGDYLGEVIVARRSPDLSVFAPSELKILALVKEQLAKKTASELSTLSHREQGYIRTRNGELISYEYADSLSF